MYVYIYIYIHAYIHMCIHMLFIHGIYIYIYICAYMLLHIIYIYRERDIYKENENKRKDGRARRQAGSCMLLAIAFIE